MLNYIMKVNKEGEINDREMKKIINRNDEKMIL